MHIFFTFHFSLSLGPADNGNGEGGLGKSDNLIPSLRVVIPPHSSALCLQHNILSLRSTICAILYIVYHILYYSGCTPPHRSDLFFYQYQAEIYIQQILQSQGLIMGMIMLQHNLRSKIYFYSCEITTKLRKNFFSAFD